MMHRTQEHYLQEVIVQYLLRRRCIPIDTDVMDGNKFARTPTDRIKYISFHKRRGYVKGQPDLAILLPNGKTLLAELKTEKGRQSAEQKAYQQAAEDLGFEYVIWHSLEDCVQWFQKREQPE